MSNRRLWTVWPIAVACAGLLMAGCASRSDGHPNSAISKVVLTNQPSAEKPNKPDGEKLKQAAAMPGGAFEGEGWRLLFDGKTLAGWKETQFAGNGETQCVSNMVVLNEGNPFTGIS